MNRTSRTFLLLAVCLLAGLGAACGDAGDAQAVADTAVGSDAADTGAGDTSSPDTAVGSDAADTGAGDTPSPDTAVGSDVADAGAGDTLQGDTGGSDVVEGPPLEAWSVLPRLSPVEGGETIELVGQGFTADTRVFIGDDEVDDVAFVDDGTLTVVTPPMAGGTYDVTVRRGGVEATLEGPLAFIRWPGPSGGPIADTVEITVTSGGRHLIEDAFVMLGTDPATPHQGFTDASGRVTFSGLSGGPITVVTAAAGYHSLMMVDVDARRITMNLGGNSEPGSGRSARLTGRVTGMDLLPEPDADETRIAVVRTSWRPSPPGPSPFQGAEVTDSNETWELDASVGLRALVAFGGLFDHGSGTFTAHRMGLVRRLFLVDGAELDVDIPLDIPLDDSLAFELAEPPDVFDADASYRVTAEIELGHDGRIFGPVMSDTMMGSETPLSRWTSEATATLDGLPAVGEGALEDARLRPSAIVHRADGGELPILATGTPIADTATPVSLAPPARAAITTPAPGEPLGAAVQFDAIGATEPDFWLVEIAPPSLQPQPFTIIAPANTRSVLLPSLPDLSGEPPQRQVTLYDGGGDTLLVRVDAQRFDPLAFSGYDSYGDPGLRGDDLRGRSSSEPVSVQP